MGRQETEPCTHCAESIPTKATQCRACDKVLTDETGEPRKQFKDYNRYGVSRHLPVSVKQQVREECGFGCVFCGAAICEYDHFKPTFANLKFDHAAEGIAMICVRHHNMKTRGAIDDTQVAAARANPRAKQQGFVREDEFFLPGFPTRLLLGREGNRGEFTEGATVQINAIPVLWFDADTEPSTSSVLSLNAAFFNESGLFALIRRNELIVVPSDGFDILTPKSELIVEWRGTRILHMNRLGSNRVAFIQVDALYGKHRFSYHDRCGFFGPNKEWIIGAKLTMNGSEFMMIDESPDKLSRLNLGCKLLIECKCGCDKDIEEALREPLEWG